MNDTIISVSTVSKNCLKTQCIKSHVTDKSIISTYGTNACKVCVAMASLQRATSKPVTSIALAHRTGLSLHTIREMLSSESPLRKSNIVQKLGRGRSTAFLVRDTSLTLKSVLFGVQSFSGFRRASLFSSMDKSLSEVCL